MGLSKALADQAVEQIRESESYEDSSESAALRAIAYALLAFVAALTEDGEGEEGEKNL